MMIGTRQGFMRGFGRFDASRRSVRDVVLAALAGTAAAAFVFHSGSPRPDALASASKLGDRLAFEQEFVPVRDTRIFDTVAMFSKLPAEPAAWTEEPVPTLHALPVQAPLRTASTPAMPRLVVASVDVTPRAVQARPPARPADLGRKAPAPILVQDEETAREPIRLVGWSVPGSQYLPTGREAVGTVSALGRGAVTLGSGAANTVRSGASTVGDVLASAGRSVTSVLSFD